MSEQFVWCVETHYDAIRKRKKKVVDREGVYQQGRGYAGVFATELAAVEFVIDRAIRQLADAKSEVRGHERRLTKLILRKKSLED